MLSFVPTNEKLGMSYFSKTAAIKFAKFSLKKKIYESHLISKMEHIINPILQRGKKKNQTVVTIRRPTRILARS